MSPACARRRPAVPRETEFASGPVGAGPDLSVGRPHLRVALAEGRVQRLKPLLAVDPSVLLLCVDAVIARLLLGHGVAHPQDVTATGLRQDLS